MEKQRFEGIIDPMIYPDQPPADEPPPSEDPEWWETQEKIVGKHKPRVKKSAHV